MASQKKAWILGLVVYWMGATSAVVWGYANDGPGGGPHRKINEIALDRFLQIATEDPILCLYDFSPSLVKYRIQKPDDLDFHSFVVTYDTVTQKGDWYAEEATVVAELAAASPLAALTPSSIVEESSQSRPFRWWIIEGGFTADEPEVHMSLRHFYDPQSRGVSKVSGATGCSYLTDVTDDADKALAWLVGSTLNPCLNAKRLAGKESKHSWAEGMTRLQAALDHPQADPALRNKAFGKAWRCLGETMHLLADMTVPAHVRNDGHPGKLGYASDPYEDSVSAQTVQDLAGGAVSANLQSRITGSFTLSGLFDVVADYTNTHFFSKDTISGTDYVASPDRSSALLRPHPAATQGPVAAWGQCPGA